MNLNDSLLKTTHQAFAYTGLSAVPAGGAYASEPQPTTTAPTNVLVFASGGSTPDLNGNLLRLTPVVSSAAPANCAMRVVGWSVYTQTDGTKLYVPTILADVTLAYTSGTKPAFNLNGTAVTCFATATVAAGVPTVNAYSPGTAASSNVHPASVVVDTIGCQFVEVQFKAAGNSMGALWYVI